MSEPVLVAIISLVGTLVGSFGGIYVAQKLVNYRLDRIENKLTTLDQLEQRIVDNEKLDALQEQRIESLEDQQDRIINDIRQLKGKTSYGY